jgi:hypothetical protein
LTIKLTRNQLFFNNYKLKIIAMIHLTLVVADGCCSCKRAEEKLNEIFVDNNNVSFTVVHLNDFIGRKIFIVPALVIENELFSYGDIDEDKLLKRINEKTVCYL